MARPSFSLFLAGLTSSAVVACAPPLSAPPTPASCPAATFPIAGICMPIDDAKEYCGKGARPEGGGCLPITCTDGEPVDLATGECLPLLALRKLQAATKPDAAFGCTNPDAGLIAEGKSVGCLEPSNLCGRGARWKDGACHADPICPLGTIADPAGGCVAVVQKSGGDTLIDVGAWVRVVVGPDGGAGTAAVCGPLQSRPWHAGVLAHGNTVLDVRADFVFPDNEVKRAEVVVTARKHVDPHVTEGTETIAVAKYMDPLWNALRNLGGLTNASSASVTVQCTLDGGSDVAASPPPPPTVPKVTVGKPRRRHNIP